MSDLTKGPNETQTAFTIRVLRAEAWAEGMRFGTSRAMRMMSDEPNLPLASAADNPYANQPAPEASAGVGEGVG